MEDCRQLLNRNLPTLLESTSIVIIIFLLLLIHVLILIFA